MHVALASMIRSKRLGWPPSQLLWARSAPSLEETKGLVEKIWLQKQQQEGRVFTLSIDLGDLNSLETNLDTALAQV
jgi:hypothetical protein